MSKNHRQFRYIFYLLWLLFLAVPQSCPATTVGEAITSADTEHAAAQPGTADFIQYWTAWHLLRAGENPYDAEKTIREHVRLGLPENRVILRAPPWTLLFMAPVLELPFALSAKVWFVSNLLMLFSALFFLQSVYPSGRKGFYAMGVAAVLFFPIWENLLWGQFSVFLLFAVCLFLWLEKKQRHFLAGIVAASLSCKPHLFLVAGPLCLLFLIQRREFNLLKGIVLGLLALPLTCMAVSSSVLRQWLESLTAETSQFGLTPVTAWKSTSLVGFFRELLHSTTGSAPLWPMWIVPLVGLALAFTVWKRYPPAPSWARFLPPVLAVSLCFAPYGWLYDLSVLLVLQSLLIARSYQQGFRPHERLLVFFTLVGIQVAAILSSFREGSNQSSFFWIAPALLFVWYFVFRKEKSGSAT